MIHALSTALWLLVDSSIVTSMLCVVAPGVSTFWTLIGGIEVLWLGASIGGHGFERRPQSAHGDGSKGE